MPHLCEMPSLPDPDPTFPLSPALEPVLPEVPFNFLEEFRSFPSGSTFCCAELGVYQNIRMSECVWENREEKNQTIMKQASKQARGTNIN